MKILSTREHTHIIIALEERCRAVKDHRDALAGRTVTDDDSMAQAHEKTMKRVHGELSSLLSLLRSCTVIQVQQSKRGAA